MEIKMKSNGRINRRKSGSSSRSKEIQQSCSPNLPGELIFLILAWIPAEILYSCMKFVCKQWHEIIRSAEFQEQHRPSQSSGLFFAQNNNYFSSFGKSKALRTEIRLPLGFKVRAGCDGLLLLERQDGTMHLANPISRRITRVPHINVHPFRHTWSFVRVSATQQYKVVLTRFSIDLLGNECAVLTLGKGCTWKVMPLSQNIYGYIDDTTSTFCVRDIVFWVNRDARHMVAFCVESEETHRIPIVACERSDKSYMPGGENLSLVFQYFHRNSADIWCLFDPKGDSWWEKKYKIDFGGFLLYTLPLWKVDLQKKPVTWVNNEVVIFHDQSPQCVLFGHNVKTGKNIEIGQTTFLQPIFYCEFVCGFTWIQLKDDLPNQ